MELLTVVGFGLNRLQLAAGGAKSFLILHVPRFFPLVLFAPSLTYFDSYSSLDMEFVNFLVEIHSRKWIYVAILGH